MCAHSRGVNGQKRKRERRRRRRKRREKKRSPACSSYKAILDQNRERAFGVFFRPREKRGGERAEGIYTPPPSPFPSVFSVQNRWSSADKERERERDGERERDREGERRRERETERERGDGERDRQTERERRDRDTPNLQDPLSLLPL